MNKNINNQWHPKPRVKIRRKMKHIPSDLGNSEFWYEVFTKGEIGDPKWRFKSAITLEQAIASYCGFKPLLDKYPAIRHEGHEISDQFERICLLHHYLNVLKIPQSKVEAALNDANRRCDIWFCIIS